MKNKSNLTDYETQTHVTELHRTEFHRTEFHRTEFISGADSTDCSKKSMKEYIEQFSPYDIIDSAYDAFLAIPDVAGAIIEGFKNYESGCDKYDYAIAAFSGILTGLLDVFLVGNPKDSILGKAVDSFVDNVVIKFAQMVFEIDKVFNKNSQRKAPNDISSAIGYLERRFKVNYDARFPNDLKGGEFLKGFNPSSHHLKSLAHCPDIVGLFFSILDQFTNKTTVVSNGKIYRLENKENGFELRGNNIISKFACGVINWVGHIMSDISGSSGTRGHKTTRGMGIPIPGFELLQFFGKNKDDEMTGLAKLTEKMYLEGYDMRFGITMSIPVQINDVLVKIFWAIRERFQYNETWKDIIRNVNKDKRRLRMSLVSAGCFSIIDIGDAVIRSEGCLLSFALRVNYIGICKFAFAGYREVAVRVREGSEDLIDTVLEKEWENMALRG